MEDLVKILGGVFVFILTMILSVLVSFLETYVVIKIAEMFSIYLFGLTFYQVWAVTYIIAIIRAGYKEKEDKKFIDMIALSIKKNLTMSFVFLFAWFTAYIIHLIVI